MDPFVAAYNGDVTGLQRIIAEKGFSAVRLRDPHPRGGGNFAAHYAAQRGHVEALALLLQHMWDASAVNVVNDAGCTPLYVAVQHGQVAAVKALLCAGASPFMCDHVKGLSPLDQADTPELKAVLAAAMGGGAPEPPPPPRQGIGPRTGVGGHGGAAPATRREEQDAVQRRVAATLLPNSLGTTSRAALGPPAPRARIPAGAAAVRSAGDAPMTRCAAPVLTLRAGRSVWPRVPPPAAVVPRRVAAAETVPSPQIEVPPPPTGVEASAVFPSDAVARIEVGGAPIPAVPPPAVRPVYAVVHAPVDPVAAFIALGGTPGSGVGRRAPLLSGAAKEEAEAMSRAAGWTPDVETADFLARHAAAAEERERAEERAERDAMRAQEGRAAVGGVEKASDRLARSRLRQRTGLHDSKAGTGGLSIGALLQAAAREAGGSNAI
jgi:hypothetical protein